MAGIDARTLINEVAYARGELFLYTERDFVEILSPHEIGLHKHIFGLLDHAAHDRLKHVLDAFDLHDLFAQKQRAGRRLRRRLWRGRLGRGRISDAGHGEREERRRGKAHPGLSRFRKTRDKTRGKIGDHWRTPSWAKLNCQVRSISRTPSGPATIAVQARPMNKPCSMTPGIAASRSARACGSAIRCNWASRSQCPPSVTKGWPSLPRRGTAGPGQPAAAVAASTARRVASAPNGEISTGSGKRPRIGTNFDWSAITIIWPEAAATISRAAAPRPRL